MSLDRRALIATGIALSASPALARAGALPPAEGDMVLGSPKAPVQLVVYASASCPHCAHWWTTVLPGLKKSFIDPGKARLVFREFLTQPPEFAAAGFLLARSVPGRYFAVLDAVFAQQTAIYDSGQLYEGLMAIGKSFGRTEAQVAAALSDQKALDALNARVSKAAVRDQIDVTPTFFVAGRKMPEQTSPEMLSSALASAFKG
ncbi:thioredoxin domain-containing protein [Caulobacter sp.]|uniref:thioredoxin domain-containing protein n=1 Tax=Caulobacter sp. TaxID=78 RepID=UPI003BAD149D